MPWTPRYGHSPRGAVLRRTAHFARERHAVKAENDQWGIEFEGQFFALDNNMPNNQETAERGVAQAIDHGADPVSTFVAIRRVSEGWTRVTSPGAIGDLHA